MKHRKIFTAVITICVCVIGTFIFRYSTIDKTAEINMDGGFIWNGIQYIPITAQAEKTGKCIAKTTDGEKIYEYKDDPSHTFLELRSFLDNHKVVREDYVIPTEGSISCVYISNIRIENKDFHETLSGIVTCNFNESFFIETNNIHYETKQIYVGYGDCPLGTQCLGYIGNVNGKWVYIYPEDVINHGTNVVIDRYECHIIPDAYTEMLSESGIFAERVVKKSP